jgi:NADH-quinone oxidoreductase subunit L
MAAVTALLTAFYMFRLLWLTFFGASRMDHEVEHHVHESPLSMTGVLMVLALLSIVGGFIGIPHFLEPMLPLPPAVPSMAQLHTPLIYGSAAIRLRRVGLAAFMYSGTPSRPARVARASGPVRGCWKGSTSSTSCTPR